MTMERCRIAYLVDTISTDTTGTEKQLIETIKRLDKDKYTVSLIYLYESVWLHENDLLCPCTYTVLGYYGFLKFSFPGIVNRLKTLINKEHKK